MPPEIIPRVEEETEPPTEPEGIPPDVVEDIDASERARLDRWLAVGEYVVYGIVGLMLLVGLWINLWVAYGHADPTVLPRFTADAEFTLAAGAVLLIAFEFRKERLKPQRLGTEE